MPKIGYCSKCGRGFGEWIACDEPDCGVFVGHKPEKPPRKKRPPMTENQKGERNG